MTIGGAITELQNLINADDVPFYYKGGIEKVIETILMELPTTKVSEDCISRADLQALFNETTTSLMDKIEQKDIEHLVRACVMVTEMIQDAPSVVPSRAEGEWVNEKGIPIPDQHAVYCSLCKSWSEYRDNFCGNCGAKMKG